jgi:hypothetical protein
MKAVLVVVLVLAACSSGNEGYEAVAGQFPDTASSETSPSPSVDELVRNTYNTAHDVCSYDANRIYKEAESRSVHDAAEWYSEGSTEGVHRAASYRGCADALLRKEKNF